jgi:hypothetical protein
VEFDIFDELYDFIVDSISIGLAADWGKSVLKIKDNFLVFETIDKPKDRFFMFGICENNGSVMFITYNCVSKDSENEKGDVIKFFRDIVFKS